MVLTKDMQIKKLEFVVEGRKEPLSDIRKKTLKEHSKYMRQHSDSHYEQMSEEGLITRLKELNEYSKCKQLSSTELREKLKSIERKRHFMIWHDNSTVANHGYLVCLVSVMYDPAIFYTNEEYKQKTGKTVDIQTIIEKPQVHFIARCSSSDAEQLAYSETRTTCIKEMSYNFTSTSGCEIVDTLRFFHGDSPAREFECGQQKGGHYYCSNCGCHAIRADEIDHALNCPLVSLQDRVNIIMKGVVSQRNTRQQKPKPLRNLSREQIEEELASRGIFDGKNKQEEQKLLDLEMKGVQRVPALLFNNPNTPLNELCLENYEILPTEPLHDVAHHIENVFTEFPHHLNKNKKAFDETVQICLGDKDSKRAVDYRAAVIKSASYLRKNCLLPEKALEVFDTLTEMQRILYSSDYKRTPQLILRYYNQAWYHAIILQDYISKPKKLTLRKMFGVYYHDLTAHAGIMLRLVSGKTANTEEEERIFNHIKRITRLTSNYGNGQIIPNLLLRLQAEKQLRSEDDVQKQQHYISTLSKALPSQSNTRITIEMTKKHHREWQAHLQHISDFLLPGEGAWWHKDNDCVEFHDITKSPNQEYGPELHHFRSSTLKDEEAYLNTCWQQCVEKKIVIPTDKIRLGLPDGTVNSLYTGFLSGPLPEDEFESEPEEDISHRDKYLLDEKDEEESDNEEQILSMIPAPDELVMISDATDGFSDYKNENNYTNEIAICTESNSKDIEALQTIRHDDQDLPMPLDIPTKSLVQGLAKDAFQDTRVQVNDKEPYCLKSNLGKALAEVLGQTEEIKKFDRQHTDLKIKRKRNGRVNDQLLQSYQNSLACIQTQVLAQNTKTQNNLIQWEKEQFLKNNLQSPSYEDMKKDETAGPLLKKLKYSKALLKEWNIDFS